MHYPLRLYVVLPGYAFTILTTSLRKLTVRVVQLYVIMMPIEYSRSSTSPSYY